MTAAPPDWWLIRRIVATVSDPRWCGGIHRDHLAEECGLQASDPRFRRSLVIAWRQRRVEFCGQYVVPPLPPASTGRATA